MISDTFLANLKRSLSEIPLHRVFFILFLFSLPFSIRKVIGILSADGIFNEYTDISVYLSDILLVATLLIYILKNKSYLLSIEHWKRLFHVEHFLLPIFIPLFFLVWSGLSIFWSESLSLAIVAFIKLIEGYALYLYILISNVPRGTFETKAEKCSTWNILQLIFTIIIISAFFQSVIAILQFMGQKSLGITFLKESIFSVYDPGVAKVFINGDIFVRSYGFFPHPNLLGGFLAISLLITMVYPLIFRFRMFHVEHLAQKQRNVPRGTFYFFISRIITKCSTWNIWHKSREMFHVEHSLGIWFYRVLIFVQLLALSFSFSKSAILAYIIGLIMLVFGIRKMFHVEHFYNDTENVPRGTLRNILFDCIRKCSTWNIFEVFITKRSERNESKLSFPCLPAGSRAAVPVKSGSIPRGLPRRDWIQGLPCGLIPVIVRVFKKMFHVEHLVIIASVALFGMVLFSFNLKLFLVQPFVERLFYIESLQGLYQAYFFQGLGIGQFVFMMQQFFDEKLLIWQFQPIHNVFLLIFSEIGIVGLGSFLWFFIYAFLKNNKNVPRGTFGTKAEKCSTWNNLESDTLNMKMFHVEHSSDIQLGRDSKSSRKVITAHLLRSLLIAIAIIMLFDHYFWDIQQGQLLWWIILGLAVSKKGY